MNVKQKKNGALFKSFKLNNRSMELTQNLKKLSIICECLKSSPDQVRINLALGMLEIIDAIHGTTLHVIALNEI